jgi:multicomponent K+:H+ antiporter subunit E
VSRWLPHPLLSATLVTVWLLLVNTFSIAQLLFGLLLAVIIPRFTNTFWPERPRVHHPLLLARYLLRVLVDIVTANFQVAYLILGRADRLRPAFVELPLDLTDKFAITVLASTVSLTPGTVSSDVSADRHTLLIHCLDAPDPEAVVAEIKARYEAPLKEIFG